MSQGIDFDKVLEINPTVALATVYRSAAKTTESGLAQSKGIDLDDKAFFYCKESYAEVRTFYEYF